MSTYHHHAATRAIDPRNPLATHGLSAHGEWKRSAMAMTCVGQACTATRDSSLARFLFAGMFGGRDEKREVDSMAEEDGT